MQWSRIVSLCVGMGLVGAVGCGGGVDAEHSLPGDPVAGAAIYARVCVACHAADGRGNGGLTGGNFSEPARLAKTNTLLLSEIRDGLNRGPVAMPAQRGALSDQEMKDALAYIRKTFGGTQN